MKNDLKIAGFLCFLIMISLAGCTTTPSYVQTYEKDKIQLKAYFPASRFFHLDKMFLAADVNDFDIKIVSFRKDLISRKKYIKTKRKRKNEYESNASYDVDVVFQVVITDRTGKILMDSDFSGHADNAESFAFGLNRETSESRAERNSIGVGINRVRENVTQSVLARVHDNVEIRKLEASGGYKVDKTALMYASKNAEILICNKLKRGISDENTDSYLETLAEDISDKFETIFKNVKVVSGYSHITQNQIIIHPRLMTIKKSDSNDAYYGRGGSVILNTEMEVVSFKNSRVFNFQGIGTLKESLLTTIPQQILGVATLGAYAKAQAAAYNSVAGARARNNIAIELLNRILSDPDYRILMKDMEEYANRSKKTRMVSSKLPMTVMLSLPSNIDNIYAEGHFVRSFSYNKETQAGTASTPLGKPFKEKLLTEMDKRFEEVSTFRSEKKSEGFNPYNVSCIVGIDIKDVQFSTEPSPLITLKGVMAVRSSTNVVFKEVDFTSSGSVSSSTEKGITESIVGSLSVTKVFVEGTIYQKKLKNGVEEAINSAVIKCMKTFDDGSFVKEFNEYAAYASAKQNGSIDEIRHFLNLYGESHYAGEMESLLDDKLSEFAKNSDNIEVYLDYVLTFPEGRHKIEIMKGLENALFSQIEMGNEVWCPVYGQFFADGYRAQTASGYCGAF